MSLSEKELLELAKMAPHKELEEKGPVNRKSGSKELLTFLLETGLKPGRNPTKILQVYEVYEEWALEDKITYTMFKRLCIDFFKVDRDIIKTNMKIITLSEIVKKLRQDEKKNAPSKIKIPST